MKQLVALIILSITLYGCENSEASTSETRLTKVLTQNDEKIAVYDFAHFEPFLQKKDGKIHVVNFWATWCAPCVKELPAFEKLNETDQEVDVLLVSMDFPNTVESGLIPFIKKNNIRSTVVLLDDSNENAWIPKINKDWQGAIPVTIIYNNKKRVFYDQSFTFDELKKEIATFK